MLRFCATAAMPAVRQAPRPTSTYSTGVAPLSSAAKISGWSASKVNSVLWRWSWPRPKNPSTVDRLCVPFIHLQVARQLKRAASGAARQRLAGAEQGGDVDAVVDHGLSGGHRASSLSCRVIEAGVRAAATTNSPGIR